MNDVTKVRIVYECSIISVVLLTFLKGMFPYMGAWWRVALIASLVGLWFSLSYLKRHNYKWGFNYIGNHLYINLLLKVQKWFQNATIIALLIPVFLKDLLYNQYCLVAYILLVGMFLGVKLATYTVEYAIYKSKFIRLTNWAGLAWETMNGSRNVNRITRSVSSATCVISTL